MQVNKIIQTNRTIEPEVKNVVKDFKINCLKYFNEECRNSTGRVIHFIGHEYCNALCLYYILGNAPSYAGAVLAGTLSIMQLGLDKLFHNLAIRKSQILVRNLKNQGKDKQFITNAVDYYLKTSGGIIYSNLVRKFKKKDIEKVVNGENAPQIPGIMTYIQTYYDVCAVYPAHEKSQKHKQKIVNKIKNVFYDIFHSTKKHQN